MDAKLVFSFINVAVLLSVLVWKLKGPMQAFVRTRHETLRDEIKTVRDQLATAQERYSEFAAKLKTIDAESAVLREQAKQDAAAARQRIAAASQRLSATIVSDARTTAGNLVSDLRSQLFLELGGRVLDRAESMMKERLTGDDRARIRREFSTQVESVQ